jgi:hypothetical protein
MMGYFKQDDPRGEYWLYLEDGLSVSIGRGSVSGVCHFNTADIHLMSGGPLDNGKAAEIMAQLMVKFGSEQGGYRKMALHRDDKYDFTSEQIALIDQTLSGIGFSMENRFDSKDILWTKET